MRLARVARGNDEVERTRCAPVERTASRTRPGATVAAGAGVAPTAVPEVPGTPATTDSTASQVDGVATTTSRATATTIPSPQQTPRRARRHVRGTIDGSGALVTVWRSFAGHRSPRPVPSAP